MNHKLKWALYGYVRCAIVKISPDMWNSIPFPSINKGLATTLSFCFCFCLSHLSPCFCLSPPLSLHRLPLTAFISHGHRVDVRLNAHHMRKKEKQCARPLPTYFAQKWGLNVAWGTEDKDHQDESAFFLARSASSCCSCLKLFGLL